LLIFTCSEVALQVYANWAIVVAARHTAAQGEVIMSDFVRICSESELPAAGALQEFVVRSRAICVANVNGKICVLDGTCPHEGGPLGEGSIEGGKVVCPWHAYAFDPCTGENEEAPEVRAIAIESKIEEGELRGKL
jgi:nitrite reductase (NADH) small subunit